MKKTNTMRVAVLLLALALVTSCFVGGTFAKYISKIDGEDSARVAYWGFETAGELAIEDLFVANYTDAISKGETDDIIAPGTSNEATFEFVYTDNATEGATAPEVAYKLTVTTTGSSCADHIKANTNIKWYLDGELAGTNGTWDELLADIQGLDGADGEAGKSYAANAVATEFAAGEEHTVAWEWVFYTSDTQDEADTAMGNKQTLDTVVLNIQIVAEQENPDDDFTITTNPVTP